MIKKPWLASRMVASSLIVFMLLLTSCGSPVSQKKEEKKEMNKQVLRVNNREEPASLHPGKAAGPADFWPVDHLDEGLMKRTPEGKLVPALARDYRMSPDKKTYTFTLKDNLKWSNGDPITAKDFEYAWKYVLNPATGSQYAYQLYYLKGGLAYNTSKETDSTKSKQLEDKVGVKALDERTLEVTLEIPTAFFLDLCSFFTYYPVDHKVQEDNPNWDKNAETYVSNGPFKLVEWNHKQNMKMVRNDLYYDKDKIHTNEIQWMMVGDENTSWQMYRAGQIDLVYPIPNELITQLKQTNDPDLHITPDLSIYYYDINIRKKPFDNLKIRQALALAINRKVLVEDVAQGGQKPAYGVVPPGIPETEDGKMDFQAQSGNLFQENLDRAKKLLAEGLREEGMDHLPPFTLLYNTSTIHKLIAEAVQEMWRKNLSITCNLQNIEQQVKMERMRKGEYEIVRDGWLGDYIDPMTFIELFTSTSTQNFSGWTNKEFDQYTEYAKNSTNQEVRMQAMHQAEKILMEQMPILPVYFYSKAYALKPGIKGVFNIVNRYPMMMYAIKE